jgi:hypothetical protein
MQIMGNGPLHCDALVHRSPAADAGAAALTSALNATMATNNSDVPALNMVRSPLFSAADVLPEFSRRDGSTGAVSPRAFGWLTPNPPTVA